MNEILWWFAQNSLTVLIMIPCVMVACRFFRDRPAVQHLLWLVILVKFVTPPIIAWPLALNDVRDLLESQETSVHATTLDSVPAQPIPETMKPDALPMEPPLAPREFNPIPEQFDRDGLEPVMADAVLESPQPTKQIPWGSIFTISALSVWLIGAIACFAIQLRRWRRYACLVRDGVDAPSHLIEEVTTVAAQLRIKSPICTIVKGISSPFLWCVGAVRLVWPHSISSPTDVLRSRGIIAHELAHLRRRDDWTTWLELGVSILWWWNPLFWFVRRRLREAAEMSCDALAIAAHPDCRHDYAELLLQFSSQSTNGSQSPVLAVGAGNVASFERRLKMILSSKVSGNLSWRGALVTAFLAVIALPYWSLAQSEVDPQPTDVAQKLDEPETVVQTDTTPTRTIKYKLVDGTSGTPLQGLKITFGAWGKLPDDAPFFSPAPSREVSTTKSAADGIVEVTVREGESPYFLAPPPNWFPMPQKYTEEKDGETTEITVVLPGMPAHDPKQPHVIKLWPGTDVSGKLLWPDGKPAANVPLQAGVYINHQGWKKRLGMDLARYSFDHGDWPNWNTRIKTDAEGNFRVTVPPEEARSWLRIGTTSLGFGAFGVSLNDPALTERLGKCIPLEYQIGGHAQSIPTITNDLFISRNNNDRIELNLQLKHGVIVSGRVEDVDGNGLRDVRLTTSGAHGPHSGRHATSGEDGRFQFMAMPAGPLTVHPDARLRKENGQVQSREVQAVFVSQSMTIPAGVEDYEITISAEPHKEVVFEWVDRREDKTQPIAYYGAFRVRGYIPDANGKPSTYWTGNTEKVERDGKTILIVKIPANLLKPELVLPADRKVTASYSDSTGTKSGPGVVELGDIHAKITRTIYGDEPKSIQ